MSGPDRIWATGDSQYPSSHWWYDKELRHGTEYIRRDRTVLAALPEVQAIVDAAVKAEREACLSQIAEALEEND